MDDGRQVRLTRRGFLAGTVAAALAACTNDGDDAASTTSSSTSPPTSTTQTTATTTPATTVPPTTAAETTTTIEAPAVTSDPFTLGVASGDPLADSVILWTRLLPVEPLGDKDVDVEWAVGADADLTDIVAGGTATAMAALGHSVHVDVTGLEADTEYFYRFRVGEFETAPARTRTFAAPGTTPDRFRFAFSSCQNWEQGYYAAYRDVVEQGDLDAFVFLGDYIYEYASGGYADERGRTTGQDFECETLDQYRQRYALYQSDPLLQAAHALVPWIITWDDHEVDNDYADDSSEEDADRDAFLARRAAGYQAWYEHMPVRLDPPTSSDYDIYRSFAHGDLLRFHVLDTRQYRADQQRGQELVPQLGDAVQFRDEELAASPDQTMLGAAQREWLFEGVASSEAIWDVLAQQVFMFGGNAVVGSDPPVVVVDTWDGYAGERQAVLETVGAAADNLVVVTGDFHSAAVADLRADPFDLSLPVVGAEIMASSISSSFFDDSQVVEDLVSAALTANPQIKWFDTRRGYTVCEVTPERWLATFRAVADQFDEGSPVETVTTWEILAGSPGVTQLT
ncbi:MAG: alkaline phosphatase D family protein [Ilumatobacter sp.]|uniref:alkaline phosphatase D family protein n=1 Tax=Ilumatobacter sp. TaxID=1967498 RepID=UPI00261E610C|nr:alkaline phosphatase D family protein [Ilumatobacter sp.]MDJ0768102.1 alkaline phosphatase D family protein [Ilumatobacter sp.]